MLRGAFITLIYAPFYVKSPEGNSLFFRGEDFSGFFPEFFPGVIITAAATLTAIITAITPLVIIITITTAIGSTPIRVKVFLFRETFQKVNSSISL